MFIPLALLASSSVVSPTPKVESHARAVVVIAGGQEISAHSWDPANNTTQKQILRQEPNGRLTVLRLTEFE